MKQLLIWIFLLLLTALTNNMAFAAPIFMSPNGSDANTGASSATAVITATRAVSLWTSGDYIHVGTGTTTHDRVWVSTGRGSGANFNFQSGFSIPSHGTERIWFIGVSTTRPPIFLGYDRIIAINGKDYLGFSDLIHQNGSSDRSVEVYGSARNHFRRIGSKNGATHGSEYANIFEFAQGSNFNLIEYCWIVGPFRYGFMVGGLSGFDNKNIFRRNVARWDGADTGQPQAGYSAYGFIGGSVDGSQSTVFQNNIAIDFNSSTHSAGAGNLEAAYYMPHGATGTMLVGNLALNIKSARGVIPADSTDDGKRNHGYHNVFWDVGGDNAMLLNRNSVSATSFTWQNNTIYAPAAGMYFAQGALANFTVNRNIFHRTNSGSGADVDTNNNIFPSSGTTGGTGETNSDTDAAAMPYITSSTLSNQGAQMLCMTGDDGTFYGDVGFDVTFTTKSIWPWKGQELIYEWASQADTGGNAALMPHNAENRGFAGPNQNLTKYIWTYRGAAEPDYSLLCAGAAGEEPPPDPAASPVSIRLNGTSRFSGSFTIR